MRRFAAIIVFVFCAISTFAQFVQNSNPSGGKDFPIATGRDATYIYVAGYDSSLAVNNARWRIEKRKLSDGTLETAFGTGGVYTVNPSPGNDWAWGIAVDATDIYVSGTEETTIGGPSIWRIEKLNKSTGASQWAVTGSFSTGDPGGGSPVAICVDSTGVYVGGEEEEGGGGNHWRIEKRSLSDGSLINTFGTNGVVLYNNAAPNTDEEVLGMAVDSSYLYAAGYENGGAGVADWRVEKRDKNTGALVTGVFTGGFNNGAITEAISSGDDECVGIAVDSNFIYLCGYDQLNTNDGEIQWRIEKRFIGNGTFDTGFGSSGVVNSNPGGEAQAMRILVNASHVFVAGYDKSHGPHDSQWRVEKYDINNGALEPAFAVNGVLTINPSLGEDDLYWGMEIDGSAIYLAGSDMSPGLNNHQWRIEKRGISDGAGMPTPFELVTPLIGMEGVIVTPSFSWEDSFGETGYTFQLSTDPAFGSFVTNQSLGAGTTYYQQTSILSSNTTYYWRVIASDGVNTVSSNWDKYSFKTTGGSFWTAPSNPTPALDGAIAVAIDSNYVYVGGASALSGDPGWYIEKRSKGTGILDSSFGTNGILSTNPSANNDLIYSIVVDEASSAIYIVGAAETGGAGIGQWRIEKRSTANGALDASWGTSGVVTGPNTGVDTFDSGFGAAFDGTNLFVAGPEEIAGPDIQWKMVKYNANGTEAWSQASNPITGSNNIDVPTGLAVDSSFVYVVGYQNQGPNVYQFKAWRIEKRDKSNGTVATAPVVEDPSTDDDSANAIAITGTDMFIVGHHYLTGSPNGNAQWRIERRKLSDLTLESSFGTGGVITENPSTGWDKPTAIAVDGSYMYICGQDAVPGDERVRIEKRLLSTGALETAFGNGGVVVENLMAGEDQVMGIVVDSTAFYIAGIMSPSKGTMANIVVLEEKRSKTDGSIGFGSAPSAVYQVEPVDGMTYVSVTPSMSWSDALEENSYTIQIATDLSFTNIVYTNTAIGADVDFVSVPPLTLALGTTYYWRVYSVNANGQTIAVNAPFSFTTVPPNPPAAFNLSAPASGAADVSVLPTFYWNSSTDVATYTLQVDTDASFTAPFTYENTAVPGSQTYFTLPSALSASSQYFWRVIAVNAGGNTTASNAPFSFITTSSSSPYVQTSNPTIRQDFPLATARDTGYLYIAGVDSTLGYGNDQWRVEKRNLVDGALVTAFGTGGAVTVNPTSGNDWAWGIAVDGSAVYVVGAKENGDWYIVKLDKSTGAVQWAQTYVVNNPSGSNGNPRCITVDGSGVYVGGEGNGSTWRIEKRLLTDGTLDISFGFGSGFVTYNGTNDEGVVGITLDANYIYAVGYENGGGGTGDWRIEKRNKSDGTTADFGSVSETLSVGDDEATGIAVDSQYMYIAGYDQFGNNNQKQWRIEKRDIVSGAPIAGFGTSGIIQSDPGLTEHPAGAVLIDSNFLYVGGSGTHSTKDSEWRVKKFDIYTGAAVAAFGNGGTLVINPSYSDDDTAGIEVDSSFIYIVGSESFMTNDVSDKRWRIERRNLNDGVGMPTPFALVTPAPGTLGLILEPSFSWEDSFGEAGYILEIAITESFSTLVYSNNTIPANTTYFQLPGGILSGGTHYYWRIGASNTSGSTISTWDHFEFTTAPDNSAWVIPNDPTPSMDAAAALGRDSNYLYIGGADSSSGDVGWRIEKRSGTNGSLVTSFGTNGVLTENPSTNNDIIWKIIVDEANGAIFVIGTDEFPGPNVARIRVEKRNSSTGALVAAFGTAGVLTLGQIGMGSFDGRATGALDGGSLYVAGADGNSGDPRWVIAKFDATTGAADGSFGASGFAYFNPSTASPNNVDSATGIAVDSSYLYVAGYQRSAPDGSGDHDSAWRIEKLNKTTGAEVWSQVENVAAQDDEATAIAIDSTYMYVVGFDEIVDPSQDNAEFRIEKRLLSDGSLETGFGTGGIMIENLSAFEDQINAIAIDSSNNFMVIAGTDRTPGLDQARWRIEKRLLTTGAPDTSFGTNGIVLPNPSWNSDEPFGVLLYSTSIYIAGMANSSAADTENLYVYVEKRSTTTGNQGFGSAPGSFWQTEPPNGSPGQTLTPVLGWIDSMDEVSYTVQIDDENTFSSPLVHEATGLTPETKNYTVPGAVLVNNTTYYWRVIAINGNGQTIAGNAPMSFQTLLPNPPTAFTQSAPTDGATGVSLTPTFGWNDTTGEDGYVLQIDDENTFAVPLTYTSATIGANQNSFNLPGGILSASTTYYWRIKAVNAGGETIASNAPFSFTTAPPGGITVSAAGSNPPSASIGKSSQDFSMLHFSIVAAGGDVFVNSITVTDAGGAAAQSKVSKMLLYKDSGNTAGALDLHDEFIAIGSLDAGGAVTFTGNFTILSGNSGSFIVLYRMAGTAALGDSFAANLTAVTSNAASTGGLPLTGNSMTVRGTVKIEGASPTSPEKGAFPGTNNVVKMHLKAAADSLEDVTVTGFNVGISSSEGFFSTSYPANTVVVARLYEDTNGNGRLDFGEPQLGIDIDDFDNSAATGSQTWTDGRIHFSGAPLFTLAANASKDLIVTFDIDPGAGVSSDQGDGLRTTIMHPAQVTSMSDYIAATGNTSGGAAVPEGPVISTQLRIPDLPAVSSVGTNTASFRLHYPGPYASNGHITSYQWDIDSDTNPEYTDAAQPNAMLSYAGQGTYSATLTINYSDGQAITRVVGGITVGKKEKEIATLDMSPTITTKGFHIRSIVGRQSTGKIYAVTASSVIEYDMTSGLVTDRVAVPPASLNLEEEMSFPVISDSTGRLYVLRDKSTILAINIDNNPPTVEASITLPAGFEGPNDIVLSNSLKRLFVLDGHGSIGVCAIDINPASGTFHTVLPNIIRYGADAHRMAIKDSANKLYIASRQGTIVVADASTMTVLRSIGFRGPNQFNNDHIYYNPANQMLYLACEEGQKIGIIDTVNDSFVAAWSVAPGIPTMFVGQQASPYKVYVAVRNNTASDSIRVLDGDSTSPTFNKLISAITLPSWGNFYRFAGIALNDATSRLYLVTDSGNRRKYILDTSNDTVLETKINELGTDASGEGDPEELKGIVLSTSPNRLFEAAFAGRIRTYDNGTNSLLGVTDLGGVPAFCANDPSVNRLYVLSSADNGVRVFDTQTLQQTAVSNTGPGGMGPIAFNPTGTHIYWYDVIAQQIRALTLSNGSTTMISMSPFTAGTDDRVTNFIINPNTKRLYAVGWSNGSDRAWIVDVNPASGTFNTVIGSFVISAQGFFDSMVVNTSNNKIYIKSEGASTVDVIWDNPAAVPTSKSTLTFTGGGVSGIAVNKANNKVYVSIAKQVSPKVVVIDGTIDSGTDVGNNIGFTEMPYAIKINEALNTVYVATSNSVVVIAGVTDTIQTTIPLNFGGAEFGGESDQSLWLEVDEVHEKVFGIRRSGDRAVFVIGPGNVPLGYVLLNPADLTSFSLGFPGGFAVDVNTGRVFVTSADGSIRVIGTGELTPSAGPANPGNALISSVALDVVMMQAKLAASDVEQIMVMSVTFEASGTGDDLSAVTNIRLYNDNNNNGILDAGDTQIANGGAWSANDGLVTFSGEPLFNINAGNSVNLLVIVDYTGTATGNQTFVAAFKSASGIGITTGATINTLTLEFPIPGGTMTIDGTPPTVPILSAPANGICTSDTVPNFNWTDATDNSGSVIYDLWLDTTNPPGSAWTSNLTVSDFTGFSLGAGTYFWKVVARDASGNSSESAVFSFTIDTSAPAAVTLNSPADSAFVVNPVAFDWTDETDPCGVTYDIFVDDAIPSGGSNLASSSFTIVSLSEGSHSWYVVSKDSAGNSNASATFNFVIDTVPPAIPNLLTPANGECVNTDFPILTWQDVSSSEPVTGVTYDLSLDGSTVATGLTVTSYTPSNALSTGTHTWQILAVDGAGNNSASTIFDFKVDLSVNVATLISPADNSSVNTVTPTFDWSDVTDACGVTYTLYVDDVLVQSGLTSSTFSGQTVTEGTHWWFIETIDGAGNASFATSFFFNLDATPPEITAFDVTPNPNNTGDHQVSWSALDTMSGLGNIIVYRSDDGGNSFNSIATVPPTQSTFTESPALAEGSYIYRIVVFDAAGNSTTSADSAPVIVDKTTPTIAITGITPNPNNDGMHTVAFTASDTGGSGMMQFDVERSDNGAGFNFITTLLGDSIDYVEGGLAEGTYVYRITAIDNAGNSTTSADSVTVVVDQTDPIATITSNPTAITNSTSATFNFSSNESGSTFEASLDFAAFTSVTSPKTYTGLTEGNHTFEVRAVDTAGNVGPVDSYSWTIDTTPPDTFIYNTPSSLSNSPNAMFEFGSDEPGTFQSKVDGGGYATSISPDVVTGLSDGSHTYYVRAIDDAGNVDPTPATYTWIVDTTPPTPPTSLVASPTPNSGEFTLTWSASTDADYYEIQSSSDGGSTWSDQGSTSGTTSTQYGVMPGSYLYRVAAFDAAGNPGTSATAGVEVMAPEILYANPRGYPATGGQAQIVGSWFGIGSIYSQTYPSGTLNSLSGWQNSETELIASIPSGSPGSMNVRVMNANESTATAPAAFAYCNPVSSSAGIPVSPGTLQEHYQMISFPAFMTADNAMSLLESTFGPYDEIYWRLFRWNPKTGAYEEWSSIDADQVLDVAGYSFWIISRSGGTIPVANALHTGCASWVYVPIQPGWNQIANPFESSVVWGNVRVGTNLSTAVTVSSLSSSTPIYPTAYFWGGSSGYLSVNATDSMIPGSGYWVYNSTSEVQVLYFQQPAYAKPSEKPTYGAPEAGALLPPGPPGSSSTSSGQASGGHGSSSGGCYASTPHDGAERFPPILVFLVLLTVCFRKLRLRAR